MNDQETNKQDIKIDIFDDDNEEDVTGLLAKISNNTNQEKKDKINLRWANYRPTQFKDQEFDENNQVIIGKNLQKENINIKK